MIVFRIFYAFFYGAGVFMCWHVGWTGCALGLGVAAILAQLGDVETKLDDLRRRSDG